MAQSEYHCGSDRSEVSSTISAKSAVPKGYSRRGKTQLEKVEEEQLAKKWEAENKRLKQLSRESSRRLARIKKKEAEERLKAVKEQSEALQRKKMVREQYYVHNIQKQVERKPKLKKAVPKADYKAVMHQKPIACQRATNKPPKVVESHQKKTEKIDLKRASEVRLEDFLQPSSNLNGLDLDVRGSMQLTMRKMGVREDPMRQSDLLDSLDLQIAAIIKSNDVQDAAQEIPEEIKDEDEQPSNPTQNVHNWKKVNNNIRREEELKKVTPRSTQQVQAPVFNRMVQLGKEEVRRDSVASKQADILIDSIEPLADSLAPKRGDANIVDVSQSTEMAKLFGVNLPSDSLEASAFNWAKKDAGIMQNMKALEQKTEAPKPPAKPEPIRAAIEKAIHGEAAQEVHKENVRSNQVPKDAARKEPAFKEQLHKEPSIQKAAVQKDVVNKEEVKRVEVKKEAAEKPLAKKHEQSKSRLKAENLSQMGPKTGHKKGGPKSRATTVFTYDDDFDVDEFIMVTPVPTRRTTSRT